MCLASRTAPARAIDEGQLFLAYPPPADPSVIWVALRALGASIPSSLDRTRPVSALTEPGSILGHRVPGGDQNPHSLADLVIEARAAQHPDWQPRRFLASMRGAPATR